MEQEENTILHISEEQKIQDDIQAKEIEKNRVTLAGGGLSKKELKKFKFLKEQHERVSKQNLAVKQIQTIKMKYFEHKKFSLCKQIQDQNYKLQLKSNQLYVQ